MCGGACARSVEPPCAAVITTLVLRVCRPGRKSISGEGPKSEKKWAENGFWPHRENRQKMAQNRKNHPQNGIWGYSAVIFPVLGPFFAYFSAIGQSPFSAHFLQISGGGPKSIFSQVGRLATLVARIAHAMRKIYFDSDSKTPCVSRE